MNGSAMSFEIYAECFIFLINILDELFRNTLVDIYEMEDYLYKGN